jgi:hypothetical protein
MGTELQRCEEVGQEQSTVRALPSAIAATPKEDSRTSAVVARGLLRTHLYMIARQNLATESDMCDDGVSAPAPACLDGREYIHDDVVTKECFDVWIDRSTPKFQKRCTKRSFRSISPTGRACAHRRRSASGPCRVEVDSPPRRRRLTVPREEQTSHARVCCLSTNDLLLPRHSRAFFSTTSGNDAFALLSPIGSGGRERGGDGSVDR